MQNKQVFPTETKDVGPTAIKTILVFYTFYLSMCQKLKFITQL